MEPDYINIIAENIYVGYQNEYAETDTQVYCPALLLHSGDDCNNKKNQKRAHTDPVNVQHTDHKENCQKYIKFLHKISFVPQLVQQIISCTSRYNALDRTIFPIHHY